MSEDYPDPPPELVQQWWEEADQHVDCDDPETYFDYVAIQAAQWGAAQKRRPKPPSLKEQALLQLDTLNADLAIHGMGCDLSQIRRALEQLPDQLTSGKDLSND
jgi:hypothetical protein